MVTTNIPIPIYGRRLHVVITEDFVKDLPEINKKYKHTLTPEDECLGMSERRQGHLLVIINVARHYKIFSHKYVEAHIAETIAHEAVHACNQLYTNIGAVVDQNNDEPQAYLTGWLVQQITLTYLKHKEDVKKI